MNYEILENYVTPLWPCFIIPRDSGTSGGLECKNNECRPPTPTCAENSQSASLGTEEWSAYDVCLRCRGKCSDIV